MKQVGRQALIDDFRRVAQELDKKPTLGEYNDHGEYSSTPIYKRFESFEALKEQAGFETGQQKIDDETLLEDLQRVADEIGRSPPVMVYDEHGEHNSKTLKSRWGNWSEVLQKAGLEPTGHSQYWRENDPVQFDKDYGTVEVTCFNCGDTKTTTPFEAQRWEKHFCDADCKYENLSNLTGENARAWNGGKVKIQCEICGVHFPVKVAETESRRFCGKACENEWKSERFSGETHPRWEENPKELHYGPSFPKQREKALERDNHVCRVCGKSSEQNREECHCGLNAHHIRKFREYDDHEQANQIENLIMLCSRCHQHVENNTITVPASVWHRQEATKAALSDMPLGKNVAALNP